MTLFFEVCSDLSSLALELWSGMPNWLWYKHSSDVTWLSSFEEFDVLVFGVCLPIFALALAAILMPYLHKILVRAIRI